MPLNEISIITPTLNAAALLGETLESLSSQNLKEVEHLLIDALSVDETLMVARKFPHLTIVSENDRGIYDGMNKGARLASGEWLLFLQADDWLPEGALDAWREAIYKNPSADILCGSAEAVRRNEGQWSRVWSVTDSASKKLTVENIALGEPMINARLIRRELFLRLGGFSLEYSLASDRDFLLRAAEAGIIQQEIDALTYRYRWHAGSSTMTEGNPLTAKLTRENLAIAKNHLKQTQGRAKAEERKVLRCWHTRLTVQAAMNALEACELRKLFEAAVDGSGENPVWLFWFVREIFVSLPGFFLRGGKTRSQLLRAEGGL